jgi:N-acetylmuramoyl-L-alanine amidase
MGEMVRDRDCSNFSCLAVILVMLLVVVEVCSSSYSAAYAGSKDAATAIGARLGGDAQRTRFVSDFTQPVSFSITLLDNPYRVIVDMPKVLFELPDDLGRDGRGLVSAYRYGQYGEDKARIVMDARGPVKVAKSFVIRPVGDQPARLVIDLVPTDAKSFAAQIAETRAKAAASNVPLADPHDEAAAIDIDKVIKEMQRSVFKSAAPIAPLVQPKPIARPTAQTTTNLVLPKKKPVIGKFASTLVPLRKKTHHVVVIDPGHGGVDPGASSRRGTREKKVTLAFSKMLGEQLRKSGRYKVYLTRSSDRFIRLRDRVRLARHKKADLFIAVHADSLRRGDAQGATVYTLSERASDREAGELAANENRADIIAGVDLGVESEQVSGILIDLAQRETNNHSMFFAQKLAHRIGTATKLTRKPLRSAGFRVLKAPDVPSVLLELGYLSSRKDEQNLLSPKWRKKVSTAIVSAIDTYFAKNLAQGR